MRTEMIAELCRNLSPLGAETAARPVPEVIELIDDNSVPADEHSTLGIVELLLKDPDRVDRINREPDRQRELLPRFLLIAEMSYALFALVMLLILNVANPAAWPHSLVLRMPPAHWSDGTALSMPLAYVLGLVLTTCVCLPTFYFHGLLSGLRLTWLQVTSEIVKGKAAGAVMLLGVLPIYVALVMGMIVFDIEPAILQWTLKLGLLLPFIAGFWGLRSMYRGVVKLADTIPEAERCRRESFLRRLTFAWAMVYAIVAPVMIYRLWELFAEALRT